MTKLIERPPDGACEGCWDARPIPGLERDYYLCDYHGSPDYGHVVHYRHCCQVFSLTDRGEDLFMVPAPARVELKSNWICETCQFKDGKDQCVCPEKYPSEKLSPTVGVFIHCSKSFKECSHYKPKEE